MHAVVRKYFGSKTETHYTLPRWRSHFFGLISNKINRIVNSFSDWKHSQLSFYFTRLFIIKYAINLLETKRPSSYSLFSFQICEPLKIRSHSHRIPSMFWSKFIIRRKQNAAFGFDSFKINFTLPLSAECRKSHSAPVLQRDAMQPILSHAKDSASTSRAFWLVKIIFIFFYDFIFGARELVLVSSFRAFFLLRE